MDAPLPANGTEQARDERAVGHSVIWLIGKAKANWKYLILGFLLLSGHPAARQILELSGFSLTPPSVEPPPVVPIVGEGWKTTVDKRLGAVEKRLGTIESQQVEIIKLLK